MKPRLAVILSSVIGFSLLLNACSDAVFKSQLDLNQPGLAYYLPKTLVTIDVIPVGVGGGVVVAELDGEEKEAAKQVGHVLVHADIDGMSRSVLVNEKGQLLDDLITSLELEVQDAEHVADVNYNYVLQYQPSILATDKVCMGVDNSNLLQFVQASTKDETPNIIVSISKLVGRLTGPGAFVAGEAKSAQLTDKKLTLKIDPLDPWDRKSVGKAIDAAFPKFRNQYRLESENAKWFQSPGGKTDCPPNSVCYRTLVPLRMALVNTSTKSFSIGYADVANKGLVNTVDITRALFVEKITTLGFANGVLNQVKIKKPSEGLAVAKLPLTVYDAVLTSALAAPGKFLGEITPDISATDYKTLLEQSQTNLDKINTIRTQLNTLRDADLDQRELSADAINISCS